MILQSGNNNRKNNLLDITNKGSVLVSTQSRGNAFALSAQTGTLAAALAAGSTVFAMRLDPGASSVRAYIERVRLQYTTIVAYTTPITAGRRLAIYRGSGANTSGGTSISTVAKKHSTSGASEFEVGQSGDVRISTTAALTTTGITFETNEFATMALTHLGAAGAHMESIFEFNAMESAPIAIEPGQLLAIRNPIIMDAAGTWQLTVRIDWYEENLTTL